MFAQMMSWKWFGAVIEKHTLWENNRKSKHLHISANVIKCHNQITVLKLKQNYFQQKKLPLKKPRRKHDVDTFFKVNRKFLMKRQ